MNYTIFNRLKHHYCISNTISYQYIIQCLNFQDINFVMVTHFIPMYTTMWNRLSHYFCNNLFYTNNDLFNQGSVQVLLQSETGKIIVFMQILLTSSLLPRRVPAWRRPLLLPEDRANIGSYQFGRKVESFRHCHQNFR